MGNLDKILFRQQVQQRTRSFFCSKPTLCSKPLHGFFLFLAVSWSARALYVFIASPIYSQDLSDWNDVANILMAGGNPYHVRHGMAWPPLWMQLLFLFKKLSLAFHWSFFAIIRVFLICVETAMALLLYKTLLRFSPLTNPAKLLLVGVALNPVSILQVCQHCNIDVIVGFWVLLAVYMLLRFQEQGGAMFWLFACFALGMGTVTKSVPICLAPLLLLSVRRLKPSEQFLGAVLLLGPALYGLSIVYVLGPDDITSKVLGYRSVPGVFGLPGLLARWGAGHSAALYPKIFETIYGCGWVCLGAWLLSRDTLDKKHIVFIATFLLLAIPTFGPGYAPQYVYWFLPLLVLLYALVDRLKTVLLLLYGVAAITYLAEYALYFNSDGSYLLNFIQTNGLLHFALQASTPADQTLLRLPLWIFYSLLVTVMGVFIAKDMYADFKKWQPRIHFTGIKGLKYGSRPEQPL